MRDVVQVSENQGGACEPRAFTFNAPTPTEVGGLGALSQGFEPAQGHAAQQWGSLSAGTLLRESSQRRLCYMAAVTQCHRRGVYTGQVHFLMTLEAGSPGAKAGFS